MRRLIEYFVPHENNHHPYITRHPALATILIALITIQTTLNFFTTAETASPQILGFATSIYQQELIALTNSERQNQGLGGLTENTTLNQAAQLKAQHMFENNYWAHVSPDGIDPWHWFEQVGYDYLSAGENLARNFDTSNGVVSAWMASPTHRDNILHDSFTEIGIAVVNGNLDGEETTLVVQLFGTPAAQEFAQAPIITAPTSIPTTIPTIQPSIPPTTVPSIAPTQVPPTQAPTSVFSQPTLQPTPTITSVATITSTPTTSITPRVTQTPLENRDPGMVLGPVENYTNTPPRSPNVTLAVISHVTSFGLSRLFTLSIVLGLILVFGAESAILWKKQLLRQNAHKLIHVGILTLFLISIMLGASGDIL